MTPAIQKLETLIAQGEIGSPTQIYFRVPQGFGLVLEVLKKQQEEIKSLQKELTKKRKSNKM